MTIAYGRDDLRDFGRLLDVGVRERAKLTIAGLERYLTDNPPAESRGEANDGSDWTSGERRPSASRFYRSRPAQSHAAEPRLTKTPADLQRMQAAADASIAAEAARVETRSAEMVQNYERENPTTIKSVTPRPVYARTARVE